MGLRLLTYVLLVGVGFWTGVVHTIASRPIHPRIIRVAQPPEQASLQLSCNAAGIEEWYRTCRARRRSASIGK